MKSIKGHLLVADETLRDPNFARTVVLMFEHTEQGAGGVVLNRPSEKTINEVAEVLIQEHSDWSKIIHVGGPVGGPLAIAHTEEEFADMELLPGVFGAIAAPKVLELIHKKAEPSLVLVNYSGWGAGQLEAELQEEAWKVWPARPEHIFWNYQKDLWTSVMAEIGGDALAKLVKVKVRPPDPLAN
jgi:putative transcriptional regulator